MFFSYFTWEIPFKGKSSSCTYKHLSGNLRQILLEIPHLKDIKGQIFAQFGSKMEKKLIIFKIFTLVSQSQSHKIYDIISVFPD